MVPARLGVCPLRIRGDNGGATTEPVRNLMLRLTQLFNLTGHPAVSLPCAHVWKPLPRLLLRF